MPLKMEREHKAALGESRKGRNSAGVELQRGRLAPQRLDLRDHRRSDVGAALIGDDSIAPVAA